MKYDRDEKESEQRNGEKGNSKTDEMRV